MLLALSDVSLSFAEKSILSNVNFVVDTFDRIGVIGENGAGKTTLLKLLTGEYTPEKGLISYSKGTNIGYLEQQGDLANANTVYEEMQTVFSAVYAAMEELAELERGFANNMHGNILKRHDELLSLIEAADGYNIDVNIKKILNGMQFAVPTHATKVAVLSGGERTRLALAKLLLKRPHVLILDEPTNHLDFKALSWLESYLKTYDGAIIAVSHDRFFLDAIANRIFEVERLAVTAYKGNYTAFAVQKEAKIALQQKKYEQDTKTVAKLEDYIARNLVRASTTKMAQSRRKQLEKMQPTQRPHEDTVPLNFVIEPLMQPYKDVLKVSNLSFSAGGKQLMQGLSFELERGERLCVVGANGSGKSTFAKIIAGTAKKDDGKIIFGGGVKPAFFEQTQSRTSLSVIDKIWNSRKSFTELQVRSHLARFGFKGEQVFKSCAALSGGEQARLRLAEISLEHPNMLLFDEPTNHLDIYALKSVSELINTFDGTVIVITHDRYLMREMGCRILEFEKGQGVFYASVESFLNANSEAAAADRSEASKSESAQKAGAASEDTAKAARPQGKEARQRTAKLREEIKTLEAQIEELQAQAVGIENDLYAQQTMQDHQRYKELYEAHSDVKFEIEQLYKKWEQALEELEQFGASS